MLIMLASTTFRGGAHAGTGMQVIGEFPVSRYLMICITCSVKRKTHKLFLYCLILFFFKYWDTIQQIEILGT